MYKLITSLKDNEVVLNVLREVHVAMPNTIEEAVAEFTINLNQEDHQKSEEDNQNENQDKIKELQLEVDKLKEENAKLKEELKELKHSDEHIWVKWIKQLAQPNILEDKSLR